MAASPSRRPARRHPRPALAVGRLRRCPCGPDAFGQCRGHVPARSEFPELLRLLSIFGHGRRSFLPAHFARAFSSPRRRPPVVFSPPPSCPDRHLTLTSPVSPSILFPLCPSDLSPSFLSLTLLPWSPSASWLSVLGSASALFTSFSAFRLLPSPCSVAILTARSQPRGGVNEFLFLGDFSGRRRSPRRPLLSSSPSDLLTALIKTRMPRLRGRYDELAECFGPRSGGGAWDI